MIRPWVRAFCWFFSLIFALVLVRTVAAIPSPEPLLQQASKSQVPQIKFRVSTKELPVQQIGDMLRQQSFESTVAPLNPTAALTATLAPTATPIPIPTATTEPTAAPPDQAEAAPPEPAVLDVGLLRRMTASTQSAAPDSPYYRKTWLTYYGRPNVPVRGILGEYDVDTLARLLREKAAAYDLVNGPDIGVQPAFHLVYGMATRGRGGDGSHLVFLDDDVVMAYINRAAAEGFAVILDIQIGALTPVMSIQRGLPYLKYPNVHLGIDPEFAMVHPGQSYPGSPIGHITGQQVNDVQAEIYQYLASNSIAEPRILLVHQFIERMILDKQAISAGYPVAVTVSVDGWGGPAEKIRKYNNFTTDNTIEFSAFKLFYRWDSPVMTERHAMGVDSYENIITMRVVPNLIIYQ